jgi:hypothetical protein
MVFLILLIFQEFLVTLMIYLKMLLITFLTFYDYDHAGAHIWAFTKCIEKWCDPLIYEDVLMQLFVFTLCGDRANDWFHHSPDKTFKTI